MGARVCKSPAAFIDEWGQFRVKCYREAGHDGEHRGDRTVAPRPTWVYDHEVVDLREREN
ncbi:hypothetical protein JOF28_001976 [Leucobacter exalbidus]|uniref:Uncharacterized protein n=1 Tax=Leucobacter exalbidus TaxID=662960 RepID=A0A940T4E3_9MICO|nr:hypothetical protein [Leucobacter exalbidus]